VKMDHVAVDLARLLGSLVGDNEDLWELGLRAYQAVYSPGETDPRLARILDRTGAVLALGSWLRWQYIEGRQLPNREAVASRLQRLVKRIERWEAP
jgi:hypothetical protein